MHLSSNSVCIWQLLINKSITTQYSIVIKEHSPRKIKSSSRIVVASLFKNKPYTKYGDTQLNSSIKRLRQEELQNQSKYGLQKESIKKKSGLGGYDLAQS